MSRKRRDPRLELGHPRRRTRTYPVEVSATRLEPRLMPAVITPFTPRFGVNANGDIAFVANTLMTAPANAAGAANAQAGVGTKLNNNDFSMTFVDVDSDGSTFNSSRADLALPGGATVLFAGLYWGAESSSSNRSKVQFQTPGSSGYATVNGSIVGASSTGDYHAFADVTSLVRAAGVGTYGVANVQANTGADKEAGWSMVIAYGDPTAPPRNLTVFDGFAVVDTKTPSVTIPISGFKAPLSGAVKASLGFITYEGDRGFDGDALKFNGSTLSDAQNPADNFLNSTISNRGVPVTTRSPNYANQFGLDADIIATSGLIANGATSATINLTTDNETYYPGVVTTAIDLYAPVLEATKSVVDLNGGVVSPGDILEYTDTVRVLSGEAGTNVVLSVPIPANTTYVPGSLVVASGANAGAKSDAVGDDQAEYQMANGRLVFRLGTGATSAAGGSLAVGGTTTITYRLRVAETTPDGTLIASQSGITLSGQSTGASLSASTSASSVTVIQAADLTLAQTVSNPTPNVGDLVTLAIDLSNVDDIVVGGVVVNDLLPTGLTYQSAIATVGTYNPVTGVWTVGTLDGTARLTIVARVVATSAVVNTASIAASGRPDLVPANNTSQATITPLRADLALTKTIGDNRPYVGQRVTFVTTVTNLGPNASANVVIGDKLPVGFSLVSAVPSAGTYDAATGRWVIAVIEGTPITLTITADVTSATASVATASILSASMYDPTAANNSSTVVVTPRTVDLAVTKAADVARPNVGDVIVLTTRVANGGTGAATGVRLLSAAGSGLTILSAVAGQGTFDPTTGVWVVGSLASEGEAVLRVTARVNSPDALASAASVAQADQPDIAPNNNTASVGIVPQKADLATTQSVSNAAPLVGDEVAFTITLGNAGPDGATNVRVRDVLPAGFLYLSSTATLGNYDPTTGLWTAGTVASGTLHYLTIRARVTAPAASTNTASVFASDQYDPNPANNAATATSTPQQVDLSLAFAFDQARPNVNGVVQYRVSVTAPGPGTATGVVISSPLPGGLSFLSAIPEAGTYDQATGTWTVGTVAPGTPINLTILAQVSGLGTISASASISGVAQFDPVATNNVAVASLTTQRSDLAVAATIDDATPNVGDTITLRVAVTNAGDDPATGVVISNSLPAGLNFLTAQGPGTFDPASGAWTIGTIAPGGERILVLRFAVAAPTSGEVMASVGTADQYDPVKGNNSSSFFLASQQAGLSLGTTVDTPTPNVGDLVTFLVTLNNIGPDASTGARIAAALPAGLRLQDATPSQGTYSNRTGTWTVGTVAGEGSATLTIRAVVTGGIPATLATSILGADQFDPGAADNVASATVTPQRADLALSIEQIPGRPDVNRGTSIIVTLSNNGPDAATNVRVRTLVPAGMRVINEDIGKGAYDRGAGLWTIPSVEPGESITLYLTADVLAPSIDDFVARLDASDQFDPTLGDRSASVAITPIQSDLGIAATVNTPNPDKGQVVTFTVTLSALGLDTSNEVIASALLPAGYTFVDASATAGGYDPDTGEWTVGTVAPGTPGVLTIRAIVGVVAPSALTASILSSEQYDPTPANDTASAFVRPKRVDLVVGDVVSNPTPNVGETITLTIRVVNAGPDAATGVVLANILPAGLSFTSSSPGQGTYNSGTGSWTVGTLAPGAEAILTLSVTVSDPDAMIHRVEVQAVNQFDTATANDSAETSIEPLQASLRLINRVNAARPRVGDEVAFTVSLDNLGIDPTTGVVVSVPLPGGLAFVSAVPNVGSYDSATGLWTIGTVASGDSAVLVLRVLVEEPDAATLVATIDQADQFDPNLNDNEARATIEPQLSDLGLSFTVDDDRPNIGDEITVFVGLRNLGGDDATGVQIRIPLPAGLIFVSDSPAFGTFDPSTGIWTVGSLAAGSSTGLTLRLRVASGNPIVIAANVATLDQFDPKADGNAISATITPRQSDLALTMTADDLTPDVGAVVAFSVTLTNVGPDGASNILVSGVLPAGLTFDSVALGRGTYDPIAGTWAVGTLASGESITLTLRARVTSPGPIVNTAVIAGADQFDPDATNGAASATLTPTRADLSASISSNAARPNVGDEIVLTVTVANTGPDDADGVGLLVALPAGLEAILAIPEQGSFSAASGLWSAGAVAAGSTRTLQIRARVVATGVMVASASIDSADEFDPDATDNTASVAITPQVADLAVTAAVDNARPDVGGLVTITFTASNAGPDAASAVRVDAILPFGLEFVSATPGAGTYDATSGTWSLATIAPGASITLRIVARVVEAGAIAPSASIAVADQFDPTAANNDASTSVVPRQADLGLTVEVDNARQNVGGLVTITVTLSDSGPDAASGVLVSSVLPAGLAYVSSDAGGGTYDPATGLWTIGTLPSGTARTLRIVARVTSAVPITPMASIVGADQFDPAVENDAASAAITPQVAGLAVGTSVDVANPDAGGLVTITVTLAGSGPDVATGVLVSSLLPSGLTYVSSEPGGGTYDPATGVWSVGSVSSETSRTLRIVARVAASGPFTATSSIVGADQFDPTPGDNTASTTITPRWARLSLTQTVDNPSPSANEVVTFTVTLANRGTGTATAASVLERLPEGFEFVSASPGAGIYDPSTGLWSVGDLAPGTTISLQLRARVARPGAAFASAEIRSGEPFNPEPAAPASIWVAPRAVDLSVRVEGLPTAVVVGQRFDVRVVATNRGPDGATGVRIPVALPAGFRLVAASAGRGTFDLATSTWLAGPIAAGESLDLVLTIEAIAAGDLAISAGPIGSDQFDAIAADDVSRSVSLVTTAPALGTSSLGGVIFNDADGDGIQDPGESGLANVQIILEGADTDGNPVRLSLVTSADGSYRFAGLKPGTYSLIFPGSTGIVGTLGGRVQAGRVDGIVIGDGVDGVGYSFAAQAVAPPTVVGPNPSPSTGRLTGIVYLDRNRNGVYDIGRDIGIATIRVILTGVDDRGMAVQVVTTTDATGAYLFEGLRPGSYSVRDGRSRYFRETRAGAGPRIRLSGEVIAAVAVEAGATARVDFGKRPVAGCRLIPLLGPDGINRPVPRGPLIRRFFPTQVAARNARAKLR